MPRTQVLRGPSGDAGAGGLGSLGERDTDKGRGRSRADGETEQVLGSESWRSGSFGMVQAQGVHGGGPGNEGFSGTYQRSDRQANDGQGDAKGQGEFRVGRRDPVFHESKRGTG